VLASFWDQKSLFGLPLGVVAFGYWLVYLNNSARNSSQKETQVKPSENRVKIPNAIPEFRHCPICAEEVKFEAVKCKFCLSDI
jgi:hypothetical protein